MIKSTHQTILFLLGFFLITLALSCTSSTAPEEKKQDKTPLTAKDIFGNPAYPAISFGGYRHELRDIQPTVEELKEDMKILAAMQIKVLRTYNVEFAHASNVLKAIRELKNEDPNFEMYVMLGAWIDCLNAWMPNPNHEEEDAEGNAAEIARAVALANEYSDIVKVIAVGNEAMVKWAASYFVQPDVILKWVTHLQELKKEDKLPKDLWITSSDNFASWGGGGGEYHVEALTQLIKAVDFISMHTYPMHDTHYNPAYWGITEEEAATLSDSAKVAAAMERALKYAQTQYENTTNYMKKLGVEKPIHIGETGWATASNGFYGDKGSKATDEYKSGIYYQKMRDWIQKAGITCFYFEAFDEPWKDAENAGGSENHFGLFKTNGAAKYAVWEWVDKGVFHGLTRGGNPIKKTFNGHEESLLRNVLKPLPTKK